VNTITTAKKHQNVDTKSIRNIKVNMLIKSLINISVVKRSNNISHSWPCKQFYYIKRWSW